MGGGGGGGGGEEEQSEEKVRDEKKERKKKKEEGKTDFGTSVCWHPLMTVSATTVYLHRCVA